MGLKGKIQENISYNGTIKVIVNDRGHKYELNLHNQGTKLLYDTVTKALAGYSIQNDVPKYIDITYSDNESGTYKSALLSPVVITGIIFGAPAAATSNDGKLLLNTEIDNSKKAPTSYSGDNWRLELLSVSKGILAIIENTNGQVKTIYDNITETNEVLIEWTLKFSAPAS